MMPLLVQIEHAGFSTWVRESGSLWAFPGILLLHTYGMALVVCLVVAIDLRILGFARALPLSPLQRLLPLLWIGFWINAVTGTMLLAADATTRLTNPDFGIKMIFIALGVVTLRRTETQVLRDPRVENDMLPAGAKSLAAASLFCWTAAITAGRLLAYVGPVSGLK